MKYEIKIRVIKNAWILEYRKNFVLVEESCGSFEDAIHRMKEILDVDFVEKNWF